MIITMAIKERYRNNIGYLYKMGTHYTSANPVWVEEGIPFRFDKISKGKKYFNPMAGTYITSTNEVWLSDSQVDFSNGDRVTTKKVPRNDVEEDFSLISELNQEPINQKGNRYRTKEYLTSRFNID
jgi:hypothetical protein